MPDEAEPRWGEDKDPADSGVIYTIDIRPLVTASGSTVSSVAWAFDPSGPTEVAKSHTAEGLLSIRPGGGTADTDYTVTATATLANGGIIERSVKLLVRQR